jgi:lambda family phage minor tail protein L
MTTPIKQNFANIHSADGIVELYVLDCSAIGGAVYRFANQCYPSGALYYWGGNAYNVIPIGVDDKEVKSDGTELPQVSITIANAPSGGPLLAPIQALGDLVGAYFYQYITKASYLDGGSEPDTTQYIGPNVWRILQKSQQTNQSITFLGGYVLDLPGQMFPVRQFLIDPGINPDQYNSPTIYFPGVSPYHTNSWQSQ